MTIKTAFSFPVNRKYCMNLIINHFSFIDQSDAKEALTYAYYNIGESI